MNDKYALVPDDILTGKDLDYLTDIFNWNYKKSSCLKIWFSI